MSATLDDFERELMQYSELGPIPEVLAPPPITIQRYQQVLRENNSTSIFDDDYSCSEANEDEENNPEAILYRNEQHVTRVTSGRGRGGRNIFHPPGSQVGLSEDDLELIRDIRKVAPLGYSNEITENAIRAHQRAKRLERRMEENKVVKSKQATPTKSEFTGHHPSSPLSSEAKTSVKSATPSRQEIDEFEDFIRQETPSPERPASVEEPAPVPISTLLKQCRERHKQNKQRLLQENETSSGPDRAVLSSQKSPKRADVPKRTDYENLPWRQRTNSPPRFAWGDRRSNSGLSLKSLQDFPPLP